MFRSATLGLRGGKESSNSLSTRPGSVEASNDALPPSVRMTAEKHTFESLSPEAHQTLPPAIDSISCREYLEDTTLSWRSGRSSKAGTLFKRRRIFTKAICEAAGEVWPNVDLTSMLEQV